MHTEFLFPISAIIQSLEFFINGAGVEAPTSRAYEMIFHHSITIKYYYLTDLNFGPLGSNTVDLEANHIIELYYEYFTIEFM